MRVLVGCEFSGTVRDAFLAAGHDAMSCDLLPSETPGPHYQGDIRDVLGDGWDLAIFHPPCTHLAVSGARWWREKVSDQEQALAFVRMLMVCGIPRIAIENPISLISSRIRKPDQIIQPWMFGHGETKRTCLWLKNLPPLLPTEIAPGNEARMWKLPPGPNRWKERSRTYPGIAAAMAAQWGGLIEMPARQPRRKTAAPTLPPTNLERFIAEQTAQQRKAPKTPYQRLAKQAQDEQLELEYLASLVGVPAPQRQVTLIKGSRYRGDFVWPEPGIRLIVEIDGAIWGRRNTQTGEWERDKPGAHVSGRGYTHDRHRDARCFLAGWYTLRFTAEMVRDQSAAYYTEQAYKLLAARKQQGVA